MSEKQSRAPKVMILGGGSRVGRYLSARLGEGQFVATFNRKPAPGGIFFDALSLPPSALADAARECTHGIILLGVADPDSCARDPNHARRLNIDATKAIIDQLDDWGVVPVFASTEAVFNGAKGLYSEADPVGPLTLYAQQKVEIEHYLATRGGPHVIARLARVVTSDPFDDTLFSTWLRQIKEGRAIRCATDHVFSPIHAEDVADALIALIKGGHNGLFHIGGPDALNRLSMLQRLVEAWRDSGQRFLGEVRPCLMADFPTLEPRPRDISLRSDKLISQTGVTPRDVNAVCQDLVRMEI